MQTKSPAFDDIANLMTNAFGAAKGVGDEVRAAARARGDKFIADMDLVSRDEFEAVKMMASSASEEIVTLKAQVKKLETAVRSLKKAIK
ncbi:MAG: pyrroline-5-carboxylate reductase [Robiginitomaculum sp.]|nr:MAG: pyrroline-5-carboxylate reductase [Robiginitomaculum sp.]